MPTTTRSRKGTTRRRPRTIRRSRLAPEIPAGRLLGAHLSVAGGLHRAMERARQTGCNAVQVFTKNNNQWAAKPISDDDAGAFRAARERHGVASVIAHASYLINLASPDDALWKRSIDAFRDELLRCEQLGITHLVFHPGAHVGGGDARGLARVAKALRSIHRDLRGLSVKTTIENTAGQGTCLGHRLDHLAELFDRVDAPGRVRFCIDTCHLLAAGYDFRTAAGYRATMDELAARVDLALVEAFHLNDSKRELGSRVDRHETIGEGEVGDEGFRHLMNDARFAHVPMVLETPKGKDEVRADTGNLRRLIDLIDG